MLAGALAAACSAPAHRGSSKAASRPREAQAPPSPASRPPRWIYTDKVGAIFDTAAPEPTLPTSEPAILDGVRVLVTSGILDGWARSDERMIGFRRLPLRFGGGYAVWSSAHTYRADTFLGELTVLADIGASGGVRPWMGSLLLRTTLGGLLLDPATRALRRVESPGFSDGIAVDDRLAVRLDVLGRASFTGDGGGTWTDVLASRGVLVSGLEEREGGGVSLASPSRPGPRLLFDRQGHLDDPPPSPPRVTALPMRQGAPPLLELPSSSRALPSEVIAHAAALGARLPGGRLLVAREGGLRILAEATALPLDDENLADVDAKLARCQPITLGSSQALLACAGEVGAEVLSLSSSLGHPRLEATFPERSLFVAGPHDRLGFVGRCGPLPPRSGDLGPGEVPEALSGAMQPDLPSTAPTATPSLVFPSLAKDARYCGRISADRWIERRLQGEEAESLYRFVPGDEGRVTALLLSEPPAEKEEASSKPRSPTSIGEGVRVIRLDSEDPALNGAAFPGLPMETNELPAQTIDADYWEDDDGAIRGWVRLPAPGETTIPHTPAFQGMAERRLPVSTARGGRSAGVRIDSEGHIKVLPLPDGVTEVVPGGRFGLAQSVKDEITTTWETVDGGLTWAVIQGPPIGSLETEPGAGASTFGCSAIGCTWGSGAVRLGWGGPPPEPSSTPPAPRDPAPALSPAMRGPRSVKVACSIAADSALLSPSSSQKAPPAPSARAVPAKAPSIKAPPPRASSRKVVPLRAPSSKVTPVKTSKAAPSTPSAIHPSAPLPISLRLGTSASIGQLGAGGAWSGDVWSPFQPSAAVKHLTATDRSLNTVQGAVIPLLGASAREPVDLLLAVGKRRLRVGAASRSFLPFDIAAKITIAADGPDGELVALDPDKGIVWIARGEAVSAALRLSRVADVSSMRFTLGRRLEGGGLVLVGYSLTTGEAFAGDLDLARAEVGPLFALGGLGTLAERGAPACSAQKGAIRFVADLLTDLRVTGKGSAPLHSQEGLKTFLIEATAERLCALGMEGGLSSGNSVDLTVRFGRDGAAAVRTSAQIARGTCSLGAAPR